MKSRITKRDFEKFSKRNTHKRKGRARAIDDIRRTLDETNVSYSGSVIRDSIDLGRRGRSARKRRDEMLTRGIFQSSRSGFGFVTPEDGYDRDIFIPEDKTLAAIHSDYVEVVFRTYKNYLGEEKTEGRVTKIIKYGIDTVIGTLMHEPSYMRGRHRVPAMWYVVPDDKRLCIRPRLSEPAGAHEGDKVSVKIRRGTNGYSPEGELLCSFGSAESREANYLAILAESGMDIEFSDEEIEQATRVAEIPLSEDGRERFKRQQIFTIDGAGAKDLDDAVSIRKTEGGWQLGVHIADVSAYVEERTPLDRCVMSRGTSVYFTDKVVPMLPTQLSNGACSLNAGEDKYALSALIDLDEDGQILGVRIVPSIINSSVRGVYSEVNEIFDGTASEELKLKYKKVIPSLKKMQRLYRVLDKKAAGHGRLDMEIAEAEIILNPAGEPVQILRRERGVAERMIEQFMLTANEAVARLLNERGIPCVYRIHERPPEDKLREFLSFAHNMGFDTSVISAEKCAAGDFSLLLEKARERDVDMPVSYALLRSMSKAKYSEICSPHFGLGLECYCHFTSPIRRLSDLATHRMIRRVLFEGKKPAAYASYAKRAARAATDSELRALDTERRIENLYKVIFMSDKIGRSFDAIVSSVTSFGLFAQLDNTCEGLIPMSDMPGCFVFDEKNLTVRSGDAVYRLGDRIRVRLEEADVGRGKLRFSLLI